jgi:hypothetical protein
MLLHSSRPVKPFNLLGTSAALSRFFHPRLFNPVGVPYGLWPETAAAWRQIMKRLNYPHLVFELTSLS